MKWSLILIVFISLLLPRSEFKSELLLVAEDGLEFEIYPSTLQQGEPFLVFVKPPVGLWIEKVLLDMSTLDIFPYKNGYASLVGMDLRAPTGGRIVTVELSDGRKFAKDVVVTERPYVSAPLGIPQKLGGDTLASQARLVSNLVDENTILDSVPSGEEVYWYEPFVLPLASAIVTDEYGYSRQTGNYSIAHKGTDFRAAKGTPVFAMNTGIVRLVHDFRIYGKTVIVDHGLGVQTFYMHLSDIQAIPGEKVDRGDPIGLSGDSGYAESPHVHVSVRINNISIDPIAFLSLFK